jgi:hypothetical protein|tara:strand:- start:606 stop:800 length:195 start_codon:yes stop_codon:yes gene_type:complete
MSKEKWKEPKDKDKWLKQLVETSEIVVKGYEKYLLNELNYDELAKLMTRLRKLLPMSIDKKYDK